LSEGLHGGMEVLCAVAMCATCCHCNLLFVTNVSISSFLTTWFSIARKKKNTTTISLGVVPEAVVAWHQRFCNAMHKI